ncbi:DASS family sodium-coupled anion symporter [Sphingobacterium rhinopitheci]|uniref:DASS family sodium-coupled anion symporter n=1 Tax=Sphingobacterium rhinopitheci TaxID=2781960 RepID=UPI001F51EF66|nr:DASS family sodium-coupled anion symporter [Sphingobacterium rhinopitheci]MCI0922186.1 DASS family sodium-coupled anion symporter [Sphingobacterium rhinopitheci]
MSYKLTPIKRIPALISLAITLLIWFVIPVPEGVNTNAWHLLALFVGTIAAIISNALPIGGISIIAIASVAITRVTNPESASGALADALSGFSNELIWLIGASIMISISLIKTGLGARIGYFFISLVGKNTLGIAYAIGVAEVILAPVTPSNTARGGGIIHPIMRSISDSFNSKPTDDSRTKVGRYLALVNYNINPITSAMFITATAPNPLIVNFIYQDSRFVLTWGMWAVAAFLPALFSLMIIPLIIYFIYPPTIKKTPDAPQFARGKLKELGSISLPEKITIAVFVILLLLWAGIPAMIFGSEFSVPPTVAAFIGLSILLLTGVLTWDDILGNKGSWDTVTWFSALVMMASFLGKLGLVSWLAQTVGSGINNLGLAWSASILILLLIYVYSHYFFASTTAHITAMFSAFFIAGMALQAPPVLWALILAFSSSIMMSITHYGTGTAPIIFGSGYTTLGEWWKVGFIVSIVNLIIWSLIGGLWWKFLGYW